MINKKRGKHGVFTSEFLKGNKYAKGNKPNKTSFNGSLYGKKHYSWKGGIQQPKNDCIHLYNGKNKRIRRPRVIYEQINGKIPNGYVIFHKNGNRYDDDPKNLVAISREELIQLNQKKGLKL